MPVPRNWQIIREVWNLDGGLIDSTFQNSGITEQEAKEVASHLNDLEEIAPTFEGEARVTYWPEALSPYP